MNPIREIPVSLGERSYSIHLGRSWLGQSAEAIRQATGAKRFVLLSVRKVYGPHGRPLRTALGRLGRVSEHFVPDGEGAKSERFLFRLLRAMANAELQRDACLVTLGGGVVTDLGGFAAALYMRGIHVIHCPTTLLAQVDASVGGKTAIDFAGVKNLVGAFHQPRAVLLDTKVLDTLPERIYRAGLGEVVKHGVIRDAALFHWMETHVEAILAREPSAVERMVRRSCEIKAEVVRRDEREAGVRAHLNFGHTLGHALESTYGDWGLQHGEAVAYGMWGAALLSERLGACSTEVPVRIEALLRRLGHLKPLPRLSEKRVLAALALDKKAKNGRTQFVLTRKIGVVSMDFTVSTSLIGWVLRRFSHPTPDVSDHS